ncbi:MFS transporter [Streptomyces sp. NPDC021093]|uniref:MFS transporter n=1 Tax=Streptomyces sp. NPDC021093 TaxID=3365112 RepID=UPI0037AD58A6
MHSWRIQVFLGSRMFSTVGDQLLQFAVPLIVYTATGSVSLAGLAFMVEWLPRLFSLPVAGLLTDRFGGRRVYTVADGLRAVACALTLLALFRWPAHTFAWTAALMAVCAFCYAQAFIALESTVPDLVPEKDLAKAQSVLQVINSGAGVFGPALGGVLLIWIPPTHLLSVAGAMFAVSALGVLALKGIGSQASRDAGAVRRSVSDDLRVGVRSLTAKPVLLSLVGVSMVVNLMVGLAVATGAALTVGHFKQDDSVFASLQMAVGVLSIAAFVLMPWLLRRVSVYRIGAVAFVVSAVGGVLMGAAPTFPAYVLGYGLCIGLCGLFNVFIRLERLHWIEPEERGRVISLIVLLNQSTMPMAGLLVAVVGGWLPVQTLFLVVGAVASIVYVLVLRPLKSRAVTAQPVEQALSG